MAKNESKQVFIKYLEDKKCEGLRYYDEIMEALDLSVKQAKEEVFDDIEKVLEWSIIKNKNFVEYKKLKERHLSTFRKKRN